MNTSTNISEGENRGAASKVPTAVPNSSAAVKAALGALRIYKLYLSAHMPGGCRFEPTCSVYAYQAIERFGVLRGMWLGLKRLLRCHPLSRKFGYDPVPETTKDLPLEAGEPPQDAGQSSATPREAHS